MPSVVEPLDAHDGSQPMPLPIPLVADPGSSAGLLLYTNSNRQIHLQLQGSGVFKLYRQLLLVEHHPVESLVLEEGFLAEVPFRVC